MAIAPANRLRQLAAAGCVIALVGFAATSFALASPAADPLAPTAFEPVVRTAAWPSWLGGGRPLFNRGSAPTNFAPAVPDTPHPAVARIIVPENGATAYGSGTLIDVRDEYGLVITNWHVVRDSQGTVEVVFPSGFRSHARPLKVDSDWDLAALVIWRPPIEPVRVSAVPPAAGDVLTIHGYGQGQYRIATGRCTAYYAPKENFPREMVELDVQARQGDSGGPIFNQHGELAGVLFGAGEGTTIGSFAPRVDSFLASLAPDIGSGVASTQLAAADRPAPEVHTVEKEFTRTASLAENAENPSDPWPSSPWQVPANNDSPARSAAQKPAVEQQVTSATDWFDHARSALALLGLAAVALQFIRLVK